MTRKRRAGALGVLIIACLVAAGVAAAQVRLTGGGGQLQAASYSGCQLSPANS
jgi:hypothetical protein